MLSTTPEWLKGKTDFELKQLQVSLSKQELGLSDRRDVEELQAVETEISRRKREHVDKAERLVASLIFKFGSNTPNLFNTSEYDVEINDNRNVYVYRKKK
jgi:hypothetical protein